MPITDLQKNISYYNFRLRVTFVTGSEFAFNIQLSNSLTQHQKFDNVECGRRLAANLVQTVQQLLNIDPNIYFRKF